MVKSAKIDTSVYEDWDVRHVQERFPQADQSLWERLGKANSRRRKYFIYREQHRERLSAPQNQVGKDPVGVRLASQSENGPEPQVADLQRDRAIEEDTPNARQPTTAKQSTTASTFVPRPVPASLNLEIIDQQSDAATQTTTESISSMAQDHLMIPNPPKASGDATEFECPYCYTIFHYRARDPWGRKKEWKQHVLRDLQPYVCTFGGCSQANTLYERRSDWMHHEIQSHRREWSCNATGHKVYKTRNDLKNHMNSEHDGSFNTDKLNQIVDLLERPASFSRFSCPLCHDARFVSLDLEQLGRHLGRHLQILATFALPSIGNDGRASNDSVAAQDSTQSDGETRKSVSLTSKDTPVFGESPSDISQTFDPEKSDSITPLGQRNPYLHQLAAFQTEVGDQQVSLGVAGHWLNDWAKQDPLRTQNLSLSEIFDEISLGRKQLQTESPGFYTVVHIREVFEVAFVSAREIIERRSGFSEGDRQNQSLLRDHLRDFTAVVLSKVTHDEFLYDSLERLQAHLSLPLPWQVPTDTDQDWSFLEPKNTQSIIVPDSGVQHHVASVEIVCKWLASVDQLNILESHARLMCPGTGSWLTKTDDYGRFNNRKLTMLLIDGLREDHSIFDKIGLLTVF